MFNHDIYLSDDIVTFICLFLELTLSACYVLFGRLTPRWSESGATESLMWTAEQRTEVAEDVSQKIWWRNNGRLEDLPFYYLYVKSLFKPKCVTLNTFDVCLINNIGNIISINCYLSVKFFKLRVKKGLLIKCFISVGY